MHLPKNRTRRQSSYRPLLLLLLLLGAACATPDPAAQAAPTPTLYIPMLRTPATLPVHWQPTPADSWQWQFNTEAGPVDLTVAADIYTLDMFDTSAASVQALHKSGRRAVCYISVGSWEDWRPDAADYPPILLGNAYIGWEGERWVDIRRLDLLGPILGKRLDQCKAKGFDGVEPDNLDGYQTDTGFELTPADQIAVNRWFAAEAHARGLGIGLKNDPEQIDELVAHFDWAITEDCFDQGWCHATQPFLDAGKAVVALEYTDTGMTLAILCPQADALGIYALLKTRALDAQRQVCPE
jgi:hypothetical protein